MLTTDKEKKPCELEHERCEQRVRQLCAEREKLENRKAEAAEAVERLNGEISRAERSGDAEVLAELRQERRDAQERSGDLVRSLSLLDQEIETARGAEEGARKAVISEHYNGLAEKQRRLTELVQESIDAAFTAIATKERLAAQQKELMNGTYPEHSPTSARQAIFHEITKRFAKLDGSPETLHPIQTVDWTSRRMNPSGGLE